ncbi:hypothetical protein lerEdw1_004696 [Lerista edwardsae]|nr:hypothetical protein lerEdw1_004696 [Lerista edwardsae]
MGHEHSSIFVTDPKGKRYPQADFEMDNTNIRMAELKIGGTAAVISMTVSSQAESLNEPPVIVKPYLRRDTNIYPNPMVIYAEESQRFLPVIGANVLAILESESGTAEEITLLDDGSENGRYNLKVRVQGQDKTVRCVRRQSQALHVPGYIEEDDKEGCVMKQHCLIDKLQMNRGTKSSQNVK